MSPKCGPTALLRVRSTSASIVGSTTLTSTFPVNVHERDHAYDHDNDHDHGAGQHIVDTSYRFVDGLVSPLEPHHSDNDCLYAGAQLSDSEYHSDVVLSDLLTFSLLWCSNGQLYFMTVVSVLDHPARDRRRSCS